LKFLPTRATDLTQISGGGIYIFCLNCAINETFRWNFTQVAALFEILANRFELYFIRDAGEGGKGGSIVPLPF